MPENLNTLIEQRESEIQTSAFTREQMPVKIRGEIEPLAPLYGLLTIGAVVVASVLGMKTYQIANNIFRKYF